jgi:hypothetical protein
MYDIRKMSCQLSLVEYFSVNGSTGFILYSHYSAFRTKIFQFPPKYYINIERNRNNF